MAFFKKILAVRTHTKRVHTHATNSKKETSVLPHDQNSEQSIPRQKTSTTQKFDAKTKSILAPHALGTLSSSPCTGQGSTVPHTWTTDAPPPNRLCRCLLIDAAHKRTSHATHTPSVAECLPLRPSRNAPGVLPEIKIHRSPHRRTPCPSPKTFKRNGDVPAAATHAAVNVAQAQRTTSHPD